MAAKQTDSEHIFVRRVLIVLGLTALVLIAWQLRTLLLMIFGAVVVATIFRSFSDRLEKTAHLRPNIAILLSITIILASIVGLILLFGSHIGDQVQTLRKTLPAAWLAFIVLDFSIGAVGPVDPHWLYFAGAVGLAHHVLRDGGRAWRNA